MAITVISAKEVLNFWISNLKGASWQLGRASHVSSAITDVHPSSNVE
jgi:hypothetical protein